VCLFDQTVCQVAYNLALQRDEGRGMQKFLQQKTFPLWYVLALTVGAAIAIVTGISSQTPKFPATTMFSEER
jgi:hypothetical protein